MFRVLKKIKRHQQYPQCHIFIAPPSYDALERRLRFRNTENEEVILQRLLEQKKNYGAKDNYDKIIVNNELIF